LKKLRLLPFQETVHEKPPKISPKLVQFHISDFDFLPSFSYSILSIHIAQNLFSP
jgi:hypothetical protein